ncbi:hypothetical protein PtA15_18A109 [Puccinia triticina]|uniref:Photolyase/cryptochrome alpha/beta domain-containing protein n=1 Tax=Puccinia triticina TaxID=208348 RepID=A0ABY7D5W6_9BASI|nr:uncharacterized protein PtA15_18A109 [Puccinia triticina]WAQ93053.1 hypothetical protein PtA15_18A109 [Puccinia triticina]
MGTKPIKLLYWFRTDLRLHDSPALLKALELNPVEFYPVWCWDPYYVYNTPVGPNRWQFLLDSMNDLSRSISRRNERSKLFVIRGEPSITLPYVWRRWGITHIAFEEDDDNRHSRPRDQSIIKAAKDAGLEVLTAPSHTLYPQEKVMATAKGKLPASYRGFLSTIEKLGPPEPALDAPDGLPNPGPITLDDPLPPEFLDRWKKAWTDRQSTEKDVNKKNRIAEDKAYRSPHPLSGPNGNFDIPTMEELGIQPATSHHRGGETVALQKLEEYLNDKEKVLKFEKPQTSPAEYNPASTTTLSAHLKFGTLSSRLFYARLKQVEQDNPKIKASTPPESLIGQLLWRDFFHLQQSQIENYHQINGNRICRYFDWRLKDKIRKDTQEDGQEDDQGPEAEKNLKAWIDGMTGFPWIDAIMRQLKTEGWIHHLARHSVACFLTRGHLYISWERGAEVFDDLLIDWDPSLNSGNWMWLSASAYFHQYFRVYSPIQFGKKFDPNGNFIRHFCPELKDFPKQYIYQPWEAPIAVQKKSNCMIGEDYPHPIVDEKQAREDCLKKMKEGYEKNRYGTDPQTSSTSSPSKSTTSPKITNSRSGASQATAGTNVSAKKPEGSGSKRKPTHNLGKSAGRSKQLKLEFKPSE